MEWARHARACASASRVQSTSDEFEAARAGGDGSRRENIGIRNEASTLTLQAGCSAVLAAIAECRGARDGPLCPH